MLHWQADKLLQTAINHSMVFNDMIWIVTHEGIGSQLVDETHQAIVRKVTGFAAKMVDIVRLVSIGHIRWSGFLL